MRPIAKNKKMILGKFQSGARPGTWSNRQLKIRCKSAIKVYLYDSTYVEFNT
jgi:hypothetical protein